MDYRYIVLIIAVTLFVVTLCEILNDFNKTDDYILEDEVVETTWITTEPFPEVTEAPTVPETTEAYTEPEETTEPTEPVTEPATEPATEPPVAYYDVPLSEDLQDHIFDLCEMYQVDPAVVVAMIRKESTYNSYAVGDNGNSFGLMQIQPRWHQGRMDDLGVTDLLDPYQNVRVGIDYLAEMLERGGTYEWALMAYNGGPNHANDMTTVGTMSHYARTVLGWANELRGE